MRKQKLSKEEIKSVEEYGRKLSLTGLCTEPANKELAEKQFRKLYKIKGYDLKKVVWYDSPKEPAERGGATAKNWGNQELYWIGFYRWPEKEGLVTYDKASSELLSIWETIGECCCWWWSFENEVWACDRPSKIKMDENNLLHCENGPAILFRDGFSVYSWHGQRVEKSWIENKDTIDPKLALTWENVEQRRALSEILGWDKVLDQLNCKILHRDWTGELIETNLPSERSKTKFVKVLCPAGNRTFAIPVPKEIKTCLEGVAWTYQMTPEEFEKMEVRT